MILSNIKNSKTNYVLKIVKTLNFLNTLKTTKDYLVLNNILNNSRKKTKQNLINYIINIILSHTNTIVNVTDTEGNVLVSVSAGAINLTKFQKKAQPMALLNIFKVLLVKAKFLRNKSVAIHFKNVKRFHESFFINILKSKLFIKSVQSYNLNPHNGCRPKKLKRIKRRTKRLVLK